MTPKAKDSSNREIALDKIEHFVKANFTNYWPTKKPKNQKTKTNTGLRVYIEQFSQELRHE